MRSAVSVILSGSAPEHNMSYPDYTATPNDHQSILIVVRHIGQQLRTKQFNRAFERVSRVNQIKILDSQNHPRSIWVRFLRNYPVENNDWGDFQTHRKALGLISIGQCNSQDELNELCRIHESLKVKYSWTLFDSRCVLFGLNPDGTLFDGQHSSDISPMSPGCTETEDGGNGFSGVGKDKDNDSVAQMSITGSITSSEKSMGGYVLPRKKQSSDSESISESLSPPNKVLGEVLGEIENERADSASESSSIRSESVAETLSTLSETEHHENDNNSSKKSDRPGSGSSSGSSLITPTNFKARTLFYPSMEQSQTLETDIEEFTSGLFWVLESKRLDKLGLRKADRSLLLSALCAPFEKKDFVGLDLDSKNNKRRADGRLKKQLGDLSLQAGLPSEAITHYQAAGEILKSVNDWLWLAGALEGQCSASVSTIYPQLRRSQTLHRNASLQGNELNRYRNVNTSSANPTSLESVITDSSSKKVIMKNCLTQAEILEKYRECVTHYGKYRQVGIIETEASIKAALVLIEQGHILGAAEFLQNAVFISLQLTEEEKMQRFNALSDLYLKLGFHRKAAFFKRVAAMRCVSPNNPQPNWALCHSLLFNTLEGYKLSLDPNEPNNCRFGFYGWPRLQIQVMQELVGTAKRKGNNPLATRHMTLLFHSMLPHLGRDERRDFAHQLEVLTKESEGIPMPLVLDSGFIIPPVHLSNIPYVKVFKLVPLTPHLKPDKTSDKVEEISPFVYTPFIINRDKTVKDTSKSDFSWVEGELCEINILLENPLPVELKISSISLMTEGVRFQVNSNALSIPADSTIPTTLTGVPLGSGNLRILGYSISTLGIHSKIRLKNLRQFSFPHVDIEIVPSLPSLSIETSKPKSEFFSSISDAIITSSSINLLMGETQECNVTLSNVGKAPIESLELSLDSRLDSKKVAEIFKWSKENILSQLPILPGGSASFTMYIFGAGDFIGQPDVSSGSGSSGVGDNSSLSSFNTNVTNQPSSMEGPSSLPSRLGAALQRAKRTESLISNRSGSSKSGGSSIASGSLRTAKISNASNVKNYEAVLKMRYSGGEGLVSKHFRNCSVAFNVEVSPSLLITKWDTLSGETSSQFYLVLDVFNATLHEMEVNYANVKQILIEKNETCRIPIPLERCPLTSIDKGNEEMACCEHIISNVNLKWSLPTETEGKATLEGIRLTSSMVPLVTVSPLMWEIMINGESAKSEEMRFSVGEMINVDVWIKSNLKFELEDVILSLECFQDYQNGRLNYRLDSRFAIIGNDSILIPKITPGNSFQHSLSIVFFAGGFYKIDFKCNRNNKIKEASQQEDVSSYPVLGPPLFQNNNYGGNRTSSPVPLIDELVWKFNPPLDLQIVDSSSAS